MVSKVGKMCFFLLVGVGGPGEERVNGQAFALGFPERPCMRWIKTLAKSGCGKCQRPLEGAWSLR